MSAFIVVRMLLLRTCMVLGLLCASTLSAGAEPVVLDGRGAVPAWPAVTILPDDERAWQIQDVIRQPERFFVAEGKPQNLGRQHQVVWLRVPVTVPGRTVVRRVLEIDYPLLNRVDVWVVRDGEFQAQQRLGNELRLSERPMPTRAHGVMLELPPGRADVVLRVQTQTSMVLPITFRTPEAFTAQESLVQLLQGTIGGLALCMLIYSLAHWVSLRDSVFLHYALLVTGNIIFVLAYFGVGAQYLWPEWPQVGMLIAPLAVMLAVASGTAFIRSTLNVREVHRPVDHLLRVCGWLAWIALILTPLGLLAYRTTQAMAMVLGLLTTAAALPVAYIRARQGDRIAAYMLGGWAFYCLGAFTVAGLLRGLVEPSPLIQHLYPLSMVLEMSAWMAVLGLRVQAIHRSADRVRLESEAMRALAHTDALTGLPNRRGLQNRLAEALPLSQPQRMLGVFLLDLDGFKPVNDLHGHDVGDALLVAVARRLQSHLRGSDVVARLGGDEFVVLAQGLGDEAAAVSLGQKLLMAFNEPFDAAGKRCEVGLTIGYALAPIDGSTAEELMKQADAAMYAGKQAGRRRVQRAQPKVAIAWS